jgi:hypothetical protein
MARQHAKPPRERRLGRLILLSLVAGVALWWATVFLIPTGMRLGLSEHAANRIPLFGFALGLSIGFGMQRSDNIKQAVRYITAPLILGAVFWFFGLLAGAALRLFGASEDFVDHVPTIGFGLGVALGIVLLIAGGYDALGKVGERLGLKRKE